jgi:hypothetical protein
LCVSVVTASGAARRRTSTPAVGQHRLVAGKRARAAASACSAVPDPVRDLADRDLQLLLQLQHRQYRS